MTNQINPSVTNPTIAEIYQNVKNGRLILKPEFQRKFVWTHEHQEEFIDTILKGFPFPEIYVCQGEVDIENLVTTQYVIDGQQRLTTIKRYIEGNHDKPLRKVSYYQDLSQQEKGAFLSYKIVVRDIGNVAEDTIRETFRRINLTKFQLDSIEIHNAVYNGAFIGTAKSLLDSVSLKEYGVFHDSEFTRMADLHFVLLVMSTLEHDGYFPQDNEIENYISEFNDEYPNSVAMKERLTNAFDKIDSLGLKKDSIWFRKSNFFTMVVEVAKNTDKLPDDLKSHLETLEENIMTNKNKSDTSYGQYYGYMYSGTNNRQARVVRAQTFRREIIGVD